MYICPLIILSAENVLGIFLQTSVSWFLSVTTIAILVILFEAQVQANKLFSSEKIQ